MNASFVPYIAMPHFHLSRPFRSLATALVIGLLCVGAAQAERADRNKPMNAEADALRYDDASQTRGPSSSGVPALKCGKTPRATSLAP